MMPIFYDFKRTLRSFPVIAMVIVILLISLAIIPIIQSFQNFNLGNSGGTDMLYDHDPSGYHFLVYTFNTFGQPLEGIQFNITIVSEGKTYSALGPSNSSGYAYFTVNVSQISNSSSDELLFQQGSSASFGGYTSSYSTVIMPAADGQVSEISSVINTVTDAVNSSKSDVLAFYAGPYLNPPVGYSLYYSVSETTNFPEPNESQMTLLAPMQNYVQIISFPAVANVSAGSYIELALFSPNGTLVDFNFFPLSNSLPSQGPINVNTLASSFFSGILAFLVPLLAIIAAYSSYGRDKTTGVLDSVLARPVTRRGLLLSRYLSVIIAVGVAVAIDALIVDAIIGASIGVYLDPVFTAAAIAAIMVEAAAFVGIMFLFSHLIRSSGALIGAGIVLFLFLDLFWGVVVTLVLFLIGGTSGSAVALQILLGSEFFNPSQFYSLATTLLSGAASGVTIQPSAYGLNIFTVILDGMAWIALPLAIAVYLATKRD